MEEDLPSIFDPLDFTAVDRLGFHNDIFGMDYEYSSSPQEDIDIPLEETISQTPPEPKQPFFLVLPTEKRESSRNLEKVLIRCLYDQSHRATESVKEQTNRRHRPVFSENVKSILKSWFKERSQKPCRRELDTLAIVTGLSEKQLRTWFTNMRMRSKDRVTDNHTCAYLPTHE